MPAHDKIVL